jgi:hypothetical protein
LTERLRCLVEMLSTCDAPGPLVERLIMHVFTSIAVPHPVLTNTFVTRQLGKIEVDLYRLLAQQGIRYATVSQYILDCTNEINACVIDFTVRLDFA